MSQSQTFSKNKINENYLVVTQKLVKENHTTYGYKKIIYFFSRVQQVVVEIQSIWP